jgi:isoleucyl-tRNA synthetase
MDRWDMHHRVIAYGRGDAFEGLWLQHPFYEREVPDHPRRACHAGGRHRRRAYGPGHGLEDYVVGSRYDLPVDNPVGGDGRFVAGTPLFEGRTSSTPTSPWWRLLKARGAAARHERFRHSYPHCWRHKTPIIFRATPQWFISMDQAGLREAALREIGQVHWMPDWGESRIDGMVRNRPDWCISRQRTWGVPITLLVHKETGDLHPRTAELIEAVAERIEQKGIDAWFALRPRTCSATPRAPTTRRSTTPWTSGSTPASPTPACWSTAMALRPRRTSTWRAPTSTAAGSSRRC